MMFETAVMLRRGSLLEAKGRGWVLVKATRQTVFLLHVRSKVQMSLRVGYRSLYWRIYTPCKTRVITRLFSTNTGESSPGHARDIDSRDGDNPNHSDDRPEERGPIEFSLSKESIPSTCG